MTIPLVPVAAMDAATRDYACFHLQLDIPGAILIRHEITPDPHEPSGNIRRIVSDENGIISDDTQHLEHCCLNCAARADIVPALAIAIEMNPTAIILALPLTANPEPLLWEITSAIDNGDLNRAHISPVISACNENLLLTDIFGDDTLEERGMGLGTTDERSVGEALCQQIEYADIVVTTNRPDQRTTSLLHHLLSNTTSVFSLSELTIDIQSHHDLSIAKARIDPQHWPTPQASDSNNIWTVTLTSHRPFHPERFTANIESLGSGALRSRGCFWLASRPECAGAWDGSGGQLSIGDAGLWKEKAANRLIVTGIDPRDRSRVLRAFAEILMSDAEMKYLYRWRGHDELDPWLGIYPFSTAG